ncbi:MAG TPA: succinate dehydrogenase, hydrophobic membrane anchor protein [Phenylobacterium sp.]|jgi:succinate dehydrogenase / fumarate reductase membrane anchor subunit|uniref:succinate dehydrogenase, hydrophobic membrane anchor protein n=1 Tax=Phenylobacterium sp. TaxID=1871053 RepID=UPI002D71AF44|nr:succinate dehydrogenase, hydrophobic membrane anchor protein [Phenylobacterium sp.]HZZ68024.1 succinate dehydrogenase, hydrophobic membrane anchor protein [Phenylobacterium sp.]
MVSYRTPLGRARGLGSAKHGAGHWVSERVTAIALVPLVIWAVYAVLQLAAGDYGYAVHWIQSPLNATLTILTLAISFWHMQAGLRVVVEDYIHKTLSKSALLLLNLFVCGLAGALAILSILKVALGGA